MLIRDGYRCRVCGRSGRLEVDHIHSMEDGGSAYDVGNLQAICRGCHIHKTRTENRARARASMDPERAAWLRELDALVE